jgi:hypothetical protein
MLCHVLIGADRISQAMAEPAPDDASGSPITAVQYYRPDHRFSAAANAGRMETARALAAQLRGPGAIAAELGRRSRQSTELLMTAPPGRTI